MTPLSKFCSFAPLVRRRHLMGADFICWFLGHSPPRADALVRRLLCRLLRGAFVRRCVRRTFHLVNTVRMELSSKRWRELEGVPVKLRFVDLVVELFSTCCPSAPAPEPEGNPEYEPQADDTSNHGASYPSFCYTNVNLGPSLKYHTSGRGQSRTMTYTQTPRPEVGRFRPSPFLRPGLPGWSWLSVM
jgi:hypothetical protein